MLHWAKAFGWIALYAGAFTFAPFISRVAMMVTALFAALAILSMLVGLLGKLPHGGYSSERAALVLGAAFLFVCAADVWLVQ